MKSKFVIPVIIFLFLAEFINGQEQRRKFIFPEIGVDFISCDAPEKDYIRGDIDPYYYGNVTDNVRALLHTEYAGIKYEQRLVNNLLGVSAGLRYTRAISSIGKTSYWSDTPEFFYLLLRQDGTTTEYVKIREIVKKSDYLGIPLELRIYPNKDWMVNIYYKLGASLNFNVRNVTDVVFLDKAMEPSEDEVSAVTEDPESFFASLYLGIGLKIGKLGKPGASLEINLPTGIVPAEGSSFVTPNMGTGFQLLVRLPL